MVPVYKVGGPHKFEGVDFSFKGVSLSDLPKYLRDGWVKSKDELHIIEAEFTEVKNEKPKKVSKKKVK